MGQYFKLRREMKQRWVFNVFFGRMVRRVTKRAEGRGVKLRDRGETGWEIK